MENLINWKTDAYKSKEDFDDENINEEELLVFEVIKDD